MTNDELNERIRGDVESKLLDVLENIRELFEEADNVSAKNKELYGNEIDFVVNLSMETEESISANWNHFIDSDLNTTINALVYLLNLQASILALREDIEGMKD